jgi:predicted transcriptional regulator
VSQRTDSRAGGRRLRISREGEHLLHEADSDLIRQVKPIAIDTDQSVQAVVTSALTRYLEEQGHTSH